MRDSMPRVASMDGARTVQDSAMCSDYMYVVERMEGMEALRMWAPFHMQTKLRLPGKKGGSDAVEARQRAITLENTAASLTFLDTRSASRAVVSGP